MTLFTNECDISRFSGDLSTVAFETEYRSIKDDPVQKFYIQCLRNASTYSRAVGYFRSSVFTVAGPAVLEFARNGGKIKLICSPDLDERDAEQIAYGYARRTEILDQVLRDEFDSLLADPRTNFGARALATLITLGNLEIKLAVRADGRGIYHEKLGVFADTLGNRVSFKGSANETWSGWHSLGNFESIEVFCSWRGGIDLTRVNKHSDHFERLWSERDPDVSVAAFPATVEEYISRFAAKGVETLLNEPVTRTTTKRSALPHQSTAIQAWEANGRRGVLEHATGSGKTFTAILALQKHVAQGNPAVILVPSKLLLEQWAKEIREEIPEATMMLVGAGYDRWKVTRRVRSMTANDTSLGPRITIAMMPTAATIEFRGSITQGDHLLVVADEVHQSGSRRNSEFFRVAAGARLGLSATPQRYGDPEGTDRLFGYFGPIIPPPITLVDAVAAGRLVPYEYNPHPLHLSATEADDWLKQTKLIQLEMARQKDGPDGKKALSERAKMLLIKRSRIAKKAIAKVGLAARIIRDHYENGQSWLVYCEDGGQLSDVLESLNELGLNPIEYHSAMSGDRSETMSWFRSFGGILVSIKCLDEGVDIPAVSHALILASSQNPRQFIQRRGRVLRHAPGKHLAIIHDAIVVPVNAETEPEQVSLLKAELVRSLEFANHAINKDAGAGLRSVAANMGLDVDSIIGFEGEEDDDG